jgi:hypothetical protein
MSDDLDAMEAIKARVATLEQQTEWLAVELARTRNVLVAMVTVASEGLLSEG